MAPRTPGRRPLTTEPRHAVGMSLPAPAGRAFDALSAEWEASKSMTATWCVLTGADALSQRLGWGAIALPAYLESAIDPSQKPLLAAVEEPKRGSIARVEPVAQVQAKIPESLYAQVERLAEHFGMATTTLCCWLAVQQLNLLLVAAHQPKVSLASRVERHLPASLKAADGQDLLVPFVARKEEERLAS